MRKGRPTIAICARVRLEDLAGVLEGLTTQSIPVDSLSSLVRIGLRLLHSHFIREGLATGSHDTAECRELLSSLVGTDGLEKRLSEALDAKASDVPTGFHQDIVALAVRSHGTFGGQL